MITDQLLMQICWLCISKTTIWITIQVLFFHRRIKLHFPPVATYDGPSVGLARTDQGRDTVCAAVDKGKREHNVDVPTC
jgi:hypothetical protein